MIDVEELTVHRGGRPVVRIHELRIEAELVAVMGPNGGGKTTLLQALDGRLPYEGRVRTDGTWFTGTEPPVPTLVEVEDLVASHGVEEPRRWLAAVGYEGPANLAHGSSGERMLAALAGALGRAGNDLLLDEPFGHLDPPHVARLGPLLADRAAQDAVLFSTHDPATAAKAERVLLLDGTVVAQGAPDEVLQPGPLSRCYDAEIEVAWTELGPLVQARGDAGADGWG